MGILLPQFDDHTFFRICGSHGCSGMDWLKRLIEHFDALSRRADENLFPNALACDFDLVLDIIW
jgi:hypothetical protein